VEVSVVEQSKFQREKDEDENLREERKKIDNVVEEERYRVDKTVGSGREFKRDAVENLLAQERAQSDQMLTEERDRADAAAEKAMALLSDEVASHLKTKTALTTRDQFLTIVSHDLRNPIGTVFSCADMLLGDSFSKWTNSENKHWVELVKRNAATALRLIEDLLDIERIAQGKLTLRFAQANVSEVIHESIENLVNLASAKNILLRASNVENVGLAVFDRDRIMQVLSNLIGNALKFTPEGGSVVLNAYNESDRLLILVRDTGPGIEDEQKKSIFERFAQVSSPDREGLGLGLYISKMLIEAHQGLIWVQSDLGKGSTFWISIPRQGPSRKVQAH